MVTSIKKLNGSLRNLHLFDRRIFMAILFKIVGESKSSPLSINKLQKYDIFMLWNFETNGVDPYVLTRKYH